MTHPRHEDKIDETCRLLRRMLVEQCDRSPAKLIATITKKFPQIEKKHKGSTQTNSRVADDLVLEWLREQFPDQPRLIDVVDTYLI